MTIPNSPFPTYDNLQGLAEKSAYLAGYFGGSIETAIVKLRAGRVEAALEGLLRARELKDYARRNGEGI